MTIFDNPNSDPAEVCNITVECFCKRQNYQKSSGLVPIFCNAIIEMSKFWSNMAFYYQKADVFSLCLYYKLPSLCFGKPKSFFFVELTYFAGFEHSIWDTLI